MRNSQRCRASAMFSAGENPPRAVTPTNPGLAYQFVDVVFVLPIFDEVSNSSAKAHVGRRVDLRLTCAECRTPEEILDRCWGVRP